MAELIEPEPSAASAPLPPNKPASNRKAFKVPKGVAAIRRPHKPPAFQGGISPTTSMNSSYISSVRQLSCYAHLRSVVRYFTVFAILGAILSQGFWMYGLIKVEAYGLAVAVILPLIGSVILIYAIYQKRIHLCRMQKLLLRYSILLKKIVTDRLV